MNNLELFYICDQVTLTDTSVEADILIPAKFHSIIWNLAIAMIYDIEDDPAQSSKFEARAEKKVDLMRQHVYRRQFDRPNFIEIRTQDLDIYS